MPKRVTIIIASLSAVVVVGTLTLLAVLPDEPRDAGPRADHPCQRVTTADLETVVPPPVTRDERVVANGGQICRWNYPLPEDGTGVATAIWPTSSIQVGVWHGRRYYVPDAVGEEFTPVPGIADAAHVDWPRFITFRKGDLVFLIENREGMNLHRTEADDVPRWRALAALVASRY